VEVADFGLESETHCRFLSLLVEGSSAAGRVPSTFEFDVFCEDFLRDIP